MITTYPIVLESDRKGLSPDDIRQALKQSLQTHKKVLLIPPDITRSNSGAGQITAMYYELLTKAGAWVDVLPALGTHRPMTREEQVSFFGADIPADRFLIHRWRDGVTTLGHIPAAFVKEASEGLGDYDIPVQVSNYLLDPSYDLILSIGQVVPHEVVGLANYTKNIVVGCGGSGFINASHIISAFYGVERIMGRVDTPVRKLFNYAEENFISKLPLTYVLTVTVTTDEQVDIMGLYIGGTGDGGGREAFEKAAALSSKLNIVKVERPIKTCVVWLDDVEFHSTWLGNKSVYRTRMAMAEGGDLLVLAPGVKACGEDEENDRLIRKFGYVGREQVLKLVKTEAELQTNLSAAAHLIHGSSDGRFSITYAAPLLGKDAVEGVGYKYADLNEMTQKYNPHALKPGFNTMPDGEEIYFIPNPALGLWKYES